MRFGIPRAQRLALLDVVTVEPGSFGENLLPLQPPTDVPVRKCECSLCGSQVIDWELGEHKKYECMKRPVVLQLQDGIKLLSGELMENSDSVKSGTKNRVEAAAEKVSDALLQAGLRAMMNEPETRTQAAEVMLSIVEAQTSALKGMNFERLMQAQKEEDGDLDQDFDRKRTVASFGEAAAETARALHAACWSMKTAEVEHFASMVDDL